MAVASAADAAVAAMIEFERQISLSREGVWGARIGSQRRGLALVMEMRLREVEPAVTAALPMQAVRKGGGRLKAVPGLGSAPDPAAVQRSFALLALLDIAAEFTALVRDPEAAQIVRRRAAAA